MALLDYVGADLGNHGVLFRSNAGDPDATDNLTFHHQQQAAGGRRRSRPARDVWHLELSAPVHVLPKFIVVVDDDVNIRDWKDVIWAITTRVDPTRDTLLVDSTPIDYLDFASAVSGPGSKMGIDATNKWPGETSREWGRPMKTRAEVTARVDEIWQGLGLSAK